MNLQLRKLNKKEIKLKSKPWINKEIQFLMVQRDKLLHQYEFKSVRNKLTKMKQESKSHYYQHSFETNKYMSSMIWKGIRSLISYKTLLIRECHLLILMEENELFPSKYLVLLIYTLLMLTKNVDSKIPHTQNNYKDYLSKMHINKSLSQCL